MDIFDYALHTPQEIADSSVADAMPPRRLADIFGPGQIETGVRQEASGPPMGMVQAGVREEARGFPTGMIEAGVREASGGLPPSITSVGIRQIANNILQGGMIGAKRSTARIDS